MIQLSSPEISVYDPTKAIMLWHQSGVGGQISWTVERSVTAVGNEESDEDAYLK